MNLQELLPFLTPATFLFMARLQVHVRPTVKPWIPDLCGLFGLAVVIVGLYVTGPHSDWDWLRLCFEGTFLGYGATGVHQSIRQHEV